MWSPRVHPREMYINRILLLAMLANLPVCCNTVFIASAPTVDVAVGIPARPTGWTLRKEIPCLVIPQRRGLLTRYWKRVWTCHIFSHTTNHARQSFSFSLRLGGSRRFLKAHRSPSHGFTLTSSVNKATVQNSESLSKDLLFYHSYDRMSDGNILHTKDKRCLRIGNHGQLCSSRYGSCQQCTHFKILLRRD